MDEGQVIIKNFSLSVADMIDASKTFKGMFILDKVDFVNFDIDFDDPFKDNWQAAIDLAMVTPSDETNVDIIKQFGDAADGKLVLCANYFQDAKFFIEKAHPNQKVIWREYGYDNYEEARKSKPNMSLFME